MHLNNIVIVDHYSFTHVCVVLDSVFGVVPDQMYSLSHIWLDKSGVNLKWQHLSYAQLSSEDRWVYSQVTWTVLIAGEKMTDEEVNELLMGQEDAQGNVNYEGVS